MKLLISLISALALSGCSYGLTNYSVKPFEDSTGKIHCCDVSIINGKEIGQLKALVYMGADGELMVSLEQSDVKAFQGQAIAATVASNTASTIATTVGAVLIAPVAAPLANTILKGVVE